MTETERVNGVGQDGNDADFSGASLTSKRPLQETVNVTEYDNSFRISIKPPEGIVLEEVLQSLGDRSATSYMEGKLDRKTSLTTRYDSEEKVFEIRKRNSVTDAEMENVIYAVAALYAGELSGVELSQDENNFLELCKAGVLKTGPLLAPGGIALDETGVLYADMYAPALIEYLENLRGLSLAKRPGSF